MQDPVGGLRDLFDQFQSAASIEFSASVELTVGPGAAACCEVLAPQKGTRGTYHYCASGDRYKIESFMDPRRYPGMNTSAAYNGERFFLLLNSGRLMSYASEDKGGTVLPTLVNPLFQLLQFLYPVADDNMSTRLRFRDIQTDVVPPDFWNVEWTPVVENGVELERAEFPGGRYEGRDYVHYVYALPGVRRTPLRIDRVTVDGMRTTSSEFTHYFSVDTTDGATYWPRSIVFRGFDSEGEEVAEISYILTDFSLNQDIPVDSTTIKAPVSARVWNDDLQSFEP